MSELAEAIKLLEENNYMLEKVSESYLYLNESILVDKIKEKIGKLSKAFKGADTDLEKKEIRAQAGDLKSEIVSNNMLKADSKKMLLGLLTGLVLTGCAGQKNLVPDIVSDTQSKPVEQAAQDAEWEGAGSITEPTLDELKDDAKYVATVLKNANIDGLEVERIMGDDTKTYEFTDGTKVVIDPENAIYIYDRSALIRQYEPLYPAMKALQQEVNKI